MRCWPWLVLPLLAVSARADEPTAPTYERDVRPLLARRCTVCHGARNLDDLDVSAGLALDTYQAVMAGVDGRAVIKPGASAASELVRRLTDPDEDRRMPLSEKPLSEKERALLVRWVDAGAPRGAPAVAAAPASTARPSPRRLPVRTLEVVVPLDLKAAATAKDWPTGPVQMALKVGPLPPITALAFPREGHTLAVGVHGAVVLWDLDAGRPSRTVSDLPGPVHALAFSPDGKTLAVGSGLPARSGSVRLYDPATGTLRHELEGHADVVVGLAFRPDGKQLASASFDQTVHLWNVETGQSSGVFKGHSDFVYDVAYDPDGRSLLSVSKDRSIKRSDAATVKELRTYSDHDADVLALAVAPSGGRFVTAGQEPQLRWWKADGDKPEKRVGGHSGPVQQLAFSADGSMLISAGGDGTVRLWDARTQTSRRTLLSGGEWQYAAALSADGKLAAAGGWDGLLRVWDTGTGKLRAVLLQPPADDPAVAVDWLAVAPSGYFSASPALAGVVRWRAGGKDVGPATARAVLEKPDALARALRGEPVPPPLGK